MNPIKTKIKKHLIDTEQTIEEFAKEVGISTTSIYNLYNGADINLSIAMKIEKVTLGKVKAKDIFREYEKINKQKKLAKPKSTKME